MAGEAIYDILVFGAGAAGAAAALRAAQRGLRTAVVDRGPRGGGLPRLEWLHPEAVTLLKGAGVSIAKVSQGVVDRVRLVDATCSRHMSAPVGRKVTVVDSREFAAMVLEHALRGGATLLRGEVVAVEVQEQGVCLRMAEGAAIIGRTLLAADGYPSLVAAATASDREIGAACRVGCCQACWRSGKLDGGEGGKSGELTLFFESEDLSSFGYAFALGGLRVAGLVVPWLTPEIRAQFDAAVRRWTDAGLLAGALNAKALPTEVRLVPRGAALEAETQVGKNTLLIGDAGGYVNAVSHEGLHGAIRSAFLAVDTCVDALKTPHPQDVLMEFDSRWRRELVDYLRPPNSDVRFLLPLVFSNKRMAERVARAFLLGASAD